jgi:nitrile hydratase subunit beta
VAALSDMGGRPEFFGVIDREPDEPVFHDPWERRVFGISVFVQTALGPPNTDAARFAMEQLPPDVYHAGYYHRWLGALEHKLKADGYLADGPRRGARARRAFAAGFIRPMLRPTLPRWLAAHVLPRLLGNKRPTLRRPRFDVGAPVRVRPVQSEGHTRQPGYVTGKPGTVITHHGAALLPDAHSVGKRDVQHLYTVEFAGTDLWGNDAESDTSVRIELFEPYLEAP